MFGSLLRRLLKNAFTGRSVVLAQAGNGSKELPQFGNLRLRRCLYGWMLFDGPFIGKCFELYGEYSESEVSIFRRYIKPGDYAIDVGANIGDLTLPMAQIVGPEGRVFAIESNPENFNVLCGNLALNQIRNVKTINRFIADSSEVDTGSRVWGRYAYTGDVWAPEFMALDDLNLPRCEFIKVDVDGKELEVLRSAKRLIQACQPVLYFENDEKARSAELLTFVLGLGYRIFAHFAPIFREDNFFGNPENAWSPGIICSWMVLALPARVKEVPTDLPEITDAEFWWG